MPGCASDPQYAPSESFADSVLPTIENISQTDTPVKATHDTFPLPPKDAQSSDLSNCVDEVVRFDPRLKDTLWSFIMHIKNIQSETQAGNESSGESAIGSEEGGEGHADQSTDIQSQITDLKSQYEELKQEVKTLTEEKNELASKHEKTRLELEKVAKATKQNTHIDLEKALQEKDKKIAKLKRQTQKSPNAAKAEKLSKELVSLQKEGEETRKTINEQVRTLNKLQETLSIAGDELTKRERQHAEEKKKYNKRLRELQEQLDSKNATETN